MLTSEIIRFKAKGEIYLRCRVRPGAAQTGLREIITDHEGETIKLDVAAPAERGKANQELIRFLAKTFGTTRVSVKIISGAGERIKLIKINRTN